MKDNPQKIIAHNAGQDKVYSLSISPVNFDTIINKTSEEFKGFSEFSLYG